VYICLELSQILTDFNNFCSDETGKMYKIGHAFTYLLLKESVANDITNVSLFTCCEPRHRGVVCRPVLTLKADILNITYGCYSQNNNVKMAAL